ncbi:hypothetical protein M3P36_08235 [Altererythrobacter sp. KTW20L]|uniref:hypothetical protein n=1 Tax=Altererythrobacter sp. KTW20L TaxID=2942210 RepID=UPI0020C000C0|nr:hypothetical protein [Altererythrobacter sp. KTW20L]MCL6251028.1 hypothetical protein [Altererythrobacter sp. KTW20L]
MVRWFLVIGALVLSSPLTAQTVIPLDRGDSFSHLRTGITLPARIGDLRLDRMTDFGDSQFDISGNYVSRDQEVMATVYIYRAGRSIATERRPPKTPAGPRRRRASHWAAR